MARGAWRRVLWVVGVGLLGVSAWDGAGGAEGVLRVCADPENLPFTDRTLQGFENRIADLIAQTMGARVEYTWWVTRYLRRMLRNTLLAGRCDIMFGLPYDERFTEELPAVTLTRPYYTTGYALVYVPGRQPSLDKVQSVDALPEGLRVGVWNRTPPQDVLALRGYAHIVTYHPWYPEEVLRDLQAGQIDAAVVWGPTAGFYNKAHYASVFVVRLLEGPDFTWRIAAIVRKDDTALLKRVNAILEQSGSQIRKILDDFGIPHVGTLPSLSPGFGESRPLTASPQFPYEPGMRGALGSHTKAH
ncbi:MAG: transporter substrate-binding domain-containing protein [Acidobacteria bacterium]|nr:transporter substrate-binding domain-containing protein [Acidobacteriota bacterium]MDW7984813.1 transporter substrate-binding domain-containing protein [Acidobacteriota bacterium]